MLSREYYRMLAKSIKDNTVINNGKMLPTINKTALISELCRELKRDNSLFNTSRFVNACDIEQD